MSVRLSTSSSIPQLLNSLGARNVAEVATVRAFPIAHWMFTSCFCPIKPSADDFCGAPGVNRVKWLEAGAEANAAAAHTSCIRTSRLHGQLPYLERLLSTWRAGRIERKQPEQQYRKFIEMSAVDPATGWQISPVVVASLCMKPTRRLTPVENAKLVALKQASPSFVVMRQLTMRFRSFCAAMIQTSSILDS